MFLLAYKIMGGGVDKGHKKSKDDNQTNVDLNTYVNAVRYPWPSFKKSKMVTLKNKQD